MTDAPGDQDLAEMARDELARALTLKWRDLVPIIPWGDSFEGITRGSRDVIVERSYLWAEASGGDILCEVRVYGGPSRWEHGATASAVIRGESGA